MATKAPAGEDAADRLAQPPGPANVLPDLPSSRFRIRCVPSEPFPTLRERIATECREQGLHGLRLSSSFNQDGRVFLVFKQF